MTILNALPEQPLCSNEKTTSVCNRILISIPGYHNAIQDYLESTGEHINEQELVTTALKLAKNYNGVETNLMEYVNKAWLCYRTLAYVQEYVDLITHIVIELRNELMMRRMYDQNTLSYVCEELLGNRLLLCTKEAYFKRIMNELSVS